MQKRQGIWLISSLKWHLESAEPRIFHAREDH